MSALKFLGKGQLNGSVARQGRRYAGSLSAELRELARAAARRYVRCTPPDMPFVLFPHPRPSLNTCVWTQKLDGFTFI